MSQIKYASGQVHHKWARIERNFEIRGDRENWRE